MLAAWRKHYKCVEALIAFQANPDLKDIHGGAFVVTVLVCRARRHFLILSPQVLQPSATRTRMTT